MAQIKSYANVELDIFQNVTVVEYQFKTFNNEFTLLRLEETFDTVGNAQIQVYTSSTFEDFDHSIKLTNEFGNLQLNSKIYQNDKLYANVNVDLFENVAVVDYQTTEFDDEFIPINAFGLPQLNFVSYEIISIESTAIFGNIQFIYNQNVLLGDRIEALSIYTIQDYASTTISSVIASLDYSIASSLAFGSQEVEFSVYPSSIGSQLEFGTSILSRNLTTNSIGSAVVFGQSQLNMKIEDVPFPSIESTVVISNPSVRYVIGPLSIATTANFGTSNFIDNIHRVLVFKNDNISKIGDNDAGVIAGRIRINPASTASVDATSGNANLPANPVGFLSVNINGSDYKIPYYNP